MSLSSPASSGLAFALAALLIGACDDGGSSGAPDAATVCASDAECSDVLYCNGAETCAPGDANANARGCVAGAPPCPAGRCIESMMRCADADCVDADGDGALAIACGGDDCDDADPGRYPGRTERCDFVDDDCDPTTLGDRDADGDGAISSLCCNGDDCGTDCDDTQPGVGPTSPEVCNRIDDDCDGTVDEGVLLMAWPDGDRDGYGDEGSVVELRCELPSDRASRGGDCDDLDAGINPDETDVCDGIDQDCDGTIDEGADTLCDDELGPLTVGACVQSPDGSDPRCHGIRCAPGADVCDGAGRNECDADLCSSSSSCGQCGRSCLVCSDGICGGGGLSFYFYMLTVRDALTDAPLAGATVSPSGSCRSTAYGTTDSLGSYTLDLELPPARELDALEVSSTDYLPMLFDVKGAGSYTVRMLRTADYESMLADPDVGLTRDPELGVLMVQSMSLPFGSVVSDPPFVVRDDGTVDPASAGGAGLYVYPNVLPGEYDLFPLGDGCSSSDAECQPRTGLPVEGGALTFLRFVCMTLGCSG
jgi:hypothetical protein